MVQIRALTEADAGAFWQLRLEGLEREPLEFGSSVEEHRATPVHIVAERLRSEARHGNFVLGAFADRQLVGTAGFRREDRAKTGHKGWVWGVYVTPFSRGKGIGGELLSALIQKAELLPGLEQIHLTVRFDGAAKRLYSSLGFVVCGLETQALKIGDSYVDQNHMVLRVNPRTTS